MSNNSLQITVISAGAGSGKTYTLTGRMIEMLSKGVRPSAIIATTFTKKAAAELQERVRARLLEKGESEAANELGQGAANIGLLNQVRSRAGVPDRVFTTQAQMRADIKHERRVEFGMEGQRFYDLVRWGDAVSVLGSLRWLECQFQKISLVANQ